MTWSVSKATLKGSKSNNRKIDDPKALWIIRDILILQAQMKTESFDKNTKDDELPS